jgi:hypothetical protein
MSQELPNQLADPSGERITLHPLCEEDFPWLLMWMRKEDKASISLLLQTTRNIKEIAIITAMINDRERVGLFTFYSATFTRLRSPYILQDTEYSLQQVEINPMVYRYPLVVLSLLTAYTTWFLKYRKATKILWEINNKDTIWREMALNAGFRAITGNDHQPQAFTLYAYT